MDLAESGVISIDLNLREKPGDFMLSLPAPNPIESSLKFNSASLFIWQFETQQATALTASAVQLCRTAEQQGSLVK
jgi:hypothetical protein